MADFSDFLKKALPWIGAAATGGVPALITLAAKEVGDALGTPVDSDPTSISNAVAHATPEQLIALKTAELGFQERMQAAGFKHVEEMARIALEEQKSEDGDRQDARKANASDRRVFWLGVVILMTFAGTMGACLYGAYQIMAGGLKITDPGIIAAVFGFLGSIVGYIAANAQQVTGFFFGSSHGSRGNSAALAEAVQNLGAAAARK